LPPLPSRLTPAQAKTQAASYTRRVVGRLVREADARGDPLHAVSAFSVACVGSHLVLVRINSGAPEHGSFKDALPCPAACTEALALLAGWDPAQPCAALAAQPPPGFVALLRLLHAPAALLNACAAPLREVELDSPRLRGRVELGPRLGCGGSADVYQLSVCDQQCALKLPRCSTEAVALSFAAEASALTLLADAPTDAVPRLLCQATRVVGRASSSQLSWPALVLSPAGEPVGAALARLPPAAAVSPARREFADRVMNGVLRGLRAAHGAGLVHCDVRPANVVLCADGAAMLVDYGLSRAKGQPGVRLGVRGFTADCVWQQDTCAARAALDLVAAALTWLCLTYGSGAGVAPWLARRVSVDAWLRNSAATAGSEEAAQLLSLSLHLRTLAAAATETPASDLYYSWPWPSRPVRVMRSTSAELAHV